MAGNVYEWCWDWNDSNYYASSPDEDPRGPASGTFRVLRSGSWYFNSDNCRVANRNLTIPNIASQNIGFRLVRAAP